MTSCPVCYESFSDSVIPRRLNCLHIVCENCITNDFFDECFNCPECFCEHTGAAIDDFSTTFSIDEHLNSIQSDYELDTSNDFECEPVEYPSQPSNPTQRAQCKEEGCQFKSISNGNGYCLAHTRHRHKSLDQGEEMARYIKDVHLMVPTDSSQDPKNQELEPSHLIDLFKKQNRIALGDAMDLIDRAKSIMFREPNTLRLEAPIITVGDIHGQFYDLLNLLEEGGKPGLQESYLFLGDYVDRGSFSCEVMFLLLALKVTFPTKIWLLRGNHESSSVSGHFGFKQECKMKYGVNVYYRFLLLFQTMPLAAVISTAYGDIFACHGGLSPSFKTLEDIDKLDRFLEPEQDLGLLDILWSDPVSDENLETMNDVEYEQFMCIDWKPNPTRGCSYCFGYKALREFLDLNNLVCVVRAHEVQESGFRKHFDPAIMEGRIKQILLRHSDPCISDVGDVTTGGNGESIVGSLKKEDVKIAGELDFPPLITIFSAPNYCDR